MYVRLNDLMVPRHALPVPSATVVGLGWNNASSPLLGQRASATSPVARWLVGVSDVCDAALIRHDGLRDSRGKCCVDSRWGVRACQDRGFARCLRLFLLWL